LYRSIIFEYNKLITDYDTKLGRYSSSEDPEEHRKLYRDLVDMSNKLRKFPFDIDELCTRPISPTRLGNIINEYESYPKVQYGMNFNVFWSRLWQIISKDSRDDLDFRAAKADFLIYILTIWILFSPVITYRVSTNFGIPAIFIIILCFLIALILYDIAVLAHENYGDYVKATFDLYRIDLAKKLGIPISLCPRRDEMAIWEKYNEFLHHCDVPESVSQLNNIIER